MTDLLDFEIRSRVAADVAGRLWGGRRVIIDPFVWPPTTTMVSEELRAPHRSEWPLVAAALDAATDRSGHARGGSDGGGNFVRWIHDHGDAMAAHASSAPRCAGCG